MIYLTSRRFQGEKDFHYGVGSCAHIQVVPSQRNVIKGQDKVGNVKKLKGKSQVYTYFLTPSWVWKSLLTMVLTPPYCSGRAAPTPIRSYLCVIGSLYIGA